MPGERATRSATRKGLKEQGADQTKVSSSNLKRKQTDNIDEKKTGKKEKNVVRKQPKQTLVEESAPQEDNSDMGSRIVMRIPSLLKASVVHRPSKVVKSPYMADILVEGAKESQLCHSPALGCSGLIVPGSSALVTPKTSASAKSKYSLDIVDLGHLLVGVNPNFCNKMVKIALENGWVHQLPKFSPKEIKSEVTVEESRFDFKCEKDGLIYYIEVKGVPNASTMDPPIKKGKQKGAEVNNVDEPKDMIAYFPDGYRKAPNDPISPRALKHINHLTRLSQEDKTVCALVFVVQRPDCNIFQPTKGDPIYRKAVYEASNSGVLILPHSVTWKDNQASWGDNVKMNLKDKTDQF